MSKRPWKTFKETGLLLLVNQILHTFGWEIVYYFNSKGELKDVCPARVKCRGFSEDTTEQSYLKIAKYMKDNSKILYKEVMDENQRTKRTN